MAQSTAFLKSLDAPSINDARKLPIETILNASTGIYSNWGPMRDGAFVASDQVAAYRSGQYTRTPVLIGYNSDEGSLFVQSMTRDEFIGSVKGGYGTGADGILAAYPHASDEEALASARALFGETLFAWPTVTWARLQAGRRAEPIYLYHNEHVPPLPPLPMFNGVKAFHGSELAFVFANPGTPPWRPED